MNYSQIDKNFANYIISLLGPNPESDNQRSQKLNTIKSIISKAFQDQPAITPHIFCFGSYPIKSYLPDSDLDVTIILSHSNTSTIFNNYSHEYLNKILFNIQGHLEAFNQEIGLNIITDINLILADVKLVKFKFENLSIDISVNNFVGLCKLVFVNYLEKNCFDSLFFKRALFLIKAWCYYEGSILGSNIGLLSSYAMEVLVVNLFNNYSSEFSNEIEALFCFFRMMKEINWEKEILTIFGKISFEDYFNALNKNESIYNEITKENKLKKEDLLLLFDSFYKFKDLDKIQNFNSTSKGITIKLMNIIDPLFQTNNLGKSVNFHNFSKIRKIFEFSNNQINLIYERREKMSKIEYLNALLQIFNKTIVSSNPELFYLSLPQPKIIIMPITTLAERDTKSPNKNIDSMKKTENDDSLNLSDAFNEKIKLKNEGNSLFIWPSK